MLQYKSHKAEAPLAKNKLGFKDLLISCFVLKSSITVIGEHIVEYWGEGDTYSILCDLKKWS